MLVSSIGNTLIDVHLNWLNWLIVGQLFIVLNFMIFLSSPLDEVNSFLPHAGRLLNYLLAEYVCLANGLGCCRSPESEGTF